MLTPKRGAIVHFALSESEIAMTTALDGESTYFLPFNKGNQGHAGNPLRIQPKVKIIQWRIFGIMSANVIIG